MGGRSVALAVAAVLAAVLPATANAGGIKLQSTFAGPITAANKLCTAEPRGLIYGTANYTASQPLTHLSEGIPEITYYAPANAPSYLDLLPQFESAARSDLCVGFTLPPNVEPKFIRAWETGNVLGARLQDTPEWPDVPETHTSTYPSGSSPVHGDDLRGLTLTLPAGYAADFTSAPRCDATAFGATRYVAPTCPAPTKVGEAFVRTSAYAGGHATHNPITGLALSNLTPAAGEVGRLGVSFKAEASLAPVKWVLGVRYAADGSGRLIATLVDAPRLTYDSSDIAETGDSWAPGDVLQAGDARIGQPLPAAATRPLYVEGLSLRLWGSQSAHPTLTADFGAQAGRCDGSPSATFSASTYAGTLSSATTTPFFLTGCSALSLPATGSVALTDPMPGAATGASIDIDLPQPAGARLPAQPEAIGVTLPAGVEIGPQLGSGSTGQPTCAAQQFDSAPVNEPAACSAATIVGEATVDPYGTGSSFSGSVHLGPPAADGDLAALLIDVAQPADADARLRFRGALRVATDGRVSVAFDDLPTLRFASLGLHLRGGDHALLTAPTTCGAHGGTVSVEHPVTGTVDAALALDTAGCSAPAAPTLTAATTTPRSGDRPATSLTVARGATASAFERLAFTLPPGTLIATGAMPACGAADAAAGTCPADAQLGGVRLAAGAGAHPLSIAGNLFLTDAPAGAIAGIALAAPAELGGVSLGTIVATGGLYPGPNAGTAILSLDLPTRARGVALDLRRVTVDLDRAGVVRQPTACGDLPTSVAVTAGGSEVRAAATAAYPQCGARAFAPSFAGSVSGETTVGGHPKVIAVVTPGGDDAAVAGIRLVLPPSLKLDAARSSAACARAAFLAGACPAAAKVGQASAKISLAADAMGSDAFLVRDDDGALGVGLRFGGVYGHAVIGRFSTGAGGAQVLSFDGVPDVPLERWALQLDGATSGLLQVGSTAGGCTKTLSWSAELTAHSGAQVQRTAAAPCAGAATGTATAPVAVISVSAKTGIKLKLTKFGSLDLQTVKLTMPKAIRINAPKAKRRGRAPFALIGAKGATPTFTTGSITLVPWGGAPSEVVSRLRTTAYTVNGRAPGLVAGTLRGKSRNVEFVLRLGFRDGSVQTRKLAVRLP